MSGSLSESTLSSSSAAAKRNLVLVADDDRAIRLVLRHCLEGAGYSVEDARDGNEALAKLRERRFAAALVDILMPGCEGLEVLSTARSEAIATPIIVITAASTMNNAVEAMKRGAYDYLTKPFANLGSVTDTVQRAVASANDVTQPTQEAPAPARVEFSGEELVGRSPAMQEVYKLIGRLVTNDANVLIYGESGTGKELVARAIHFKSPRRQEPFVAVNCSAIPQGLIESELFGHERGAFTGATERRPGKFELAGAGTLFLDEVADLPLELQPKLLRALQEREFSRVGGSEMLKLRARIIAASNQPLEDAVAARKFREDLYYRLRVIPIYLPPLRERREDILELAEFFVAKAAREMGARATRLSPEAARLLVEQRWPGNVRQLENCVIRAALMAAGDTIRAEDLALEGESTGSKPTPVPEDASLQQLLVKMIRRELDQFEDDAAANLHTRLVAELERPLIELVLDRTGGNQVKAARLLGLNRNTLRKKIIEHRIVLKKFPSP